MECWMLWRCFGTVRKASWGIKQRVQLLSGCLLPCAFVWLSWHSDSWCTELVCVQHLSCVPEKCSSLGSDKRACWSSSRLRRGAWASELDKSVQVIGMP